MRSGTKVGATAGVLFAGALVAIVRLRNRHAIGNSAVPEPAKRVNLDRYLGRWFEIARYEQSFERGCTNVTAEYNLRDDGTIEVLNSCRRPSGRFRIARGVAKTVSASNAKLKVRFFGPFSGDYWILDHADDYSWSIVGEPTGRYLWLLARQADPGAEKVEQLIERAAKMGYDTSMLIATAQS